MSKDSIKEAAIKIYAEKGYEGTKLAEIAKDVGIKTASLYFHFDSKEQLFTEAFYHVKEKKIQRISQLREEILPLDSAKDQLSALFQFFAGRKYEENQEELFWKRSTLFPPDFLKDEIHGVLVAYQSDFIENTLKPILINGMKIGELPKDRLDVGVVGFFGVIDALFNEISYSKADVYREKVKILWNFYWHSLSNH